VGPLVEGGVLVSGSVERPSIDEWGMMMAAVVAARGTCRRRRVGCVLLDDKGLVLATGYNGPASGLPHCIDSPCRGAALPSGEGLDVCEAIHAEQNALIQCTDVRRIKTCYVTVSPCVHCVKMLMNTGCSRIVFGNAYSHPDARDLWLGSSGWSTREWICLPD